MSLNSRVPRSHSVTSEPGQAWELDGDGNVVPSENTYLETGQGWELGSASVLTPSQLALSNDDLWELDGSGNLIPKSA